MKSQLIAIVAAVLVGCGESQQSASAPEAKPVEPVAEATQPEPPLVKLEAPDFSIREAIGEGYIQAVMQHLAAGTDVNAKDERGGTALYSSVIGAYKEIIKMLVNKGADVAVKNNAGFTPLHEGAYSGQKEIVELLITSGADVNAMKIDGMTPLDMATFGNHNETADLLRKHGAKTGAELKAEGK